MAFGHDRVFEASRANGVVLVHDTVVEDAEADGDASLTEQGSFDGCVATSSLGCVLNVVEGLRHLAGAGAILVEQTYLSAEELDRSEDAVRRRFRHFVVPALEARDGTGGEYLSRTREVEQAVAAAIEALGNLARQSPRDRHR